MSKDQGVPDVLASDGNWYVGANLSFSDGPDVDRSVWTSPVWAAVNNPSSIDQTSIRNQTDFGYPFGCVPVKDGRAQLVLSTWNPCDPTNSTFLGSQISTIEKWGLASYDGVMFQARVRFPYHMPPGAVASLFSYNLITAAPFVHDEIDFEFASAHWKAPNLAAGAGSTPTPTTPPDPTVNTNVYIQNVNNDQENDVVVASTADFSQPVEFMIRWTAADIRWYINGALVRTETQVPQTDMSLTLNFWVPNNTWPWAYDGSLVPSGAPGTQWLYEVDWANVYVLPKQQAG